MSNQSCPLPEHDPPSIPSPPSPTEHEPPEHEIRRARSMPVSRFVSSWIHFKWMDAMEKGPNVKPDNNSDSLDEENYEDDEEEQDQEVYEYGYKNGSVNTKSVHKLYRNGIGNSSGSVSGSGGNIGRFRIRIPAEQVFEDVKLVSNIKDVFFALQDSSPGHIAPNPIECSMKSSVFEPELCTKLLDTKVIYLDKAIDKEGSDILLPEFSRCQNISNSTFVFPLENKPEGLEPSSAGSAKLPMPRSNVSNLEHLNQLKNLINNERE